MTRLRFLATLALLAAMIVAFHDYAVPHGRGLAARGAILAIDEYRAHVSPHLRGVVRCRFKPTCSAYGREAIRKYGFAEGSLKTAWRLARCGPWTKQGTIDPP
jgi:putative membrane protein insertion efficiency factor